MVSNRHPLPYLKELLKRTRSFGAYMPWTMDDEDSDATDPIPSDDDDVDSTSKEEQGDGASRSNYFNFVVSVSGDLPVLIVPTPTARLEAAELLPHGWGQPVFVPREQAVADNGALCNILGAYRLGLSGRFCHPAIKSDPAEWEAPRQVSPPWNPSRHFRFPSDTSEN